MTHVKTPLNCGHGYSELDGEMARGSIIRLRWWSALLLGGMTACQALPPALSPTPTAVAGGPAPTVSPVPTWTPTAAATLALPTLDPALQPSQESLLAYVEALSTIQPHAGWRNSASHGEREALDYVEQTLQQATYLQQLGLEIERQSFSVFIGTELWKAGLTLTVDGRERTVPADGLRGHRRDLGLALHMDSDGTLNDTERNPVTVAGPIVALRTAQEIKAARAATLQGKIVFVDYAVIDRSIVDRNAATALARTIVEKKPAGLVLVTRFTNTAGESHGAFVGDTSVLESLALPALPPVLFVTQEALAAAAALPDWEALARVTAAQLTWDADILSPARSGNLIARIPGADPTRALILGAHIDSPNSPGALDDGSGSAILLEVARVLNAAQRQPPVDLYLVWFGSEELGLNGSAAFAAAHSELLDRTVGLFNIDMLAYPLDGISATLHLETWSYDLLGSDRRPWPDYLNQLAAHQGVATQIEDYHVYMSDNSMVAAFNVPNINLIYTDLPAMDAVGGIHYASQIHSPYDTITLARAQGMIFEQMARLALATALTPPPGRAEMQVVPAPQRRALLVASHTESPHMGPAILADLGMALGLAGFDVDALPYGQPVTPGDLAATDLVIVLPVVDFPAPAGDVTLYDEQWSPDEIAALEDYVAQGGLLVVSNSAAQLYYGQLALDVNEDWGDMNDLVERFGVTYQRKTVTATAAAVEGRHPLTQDVKRLFLSGSGVPFKLRQGEVLARADNQPVVGVLSQGQGEVVVLADLGILTTPVSAGGGNLTFWQALIRYAQQRK